MADELLSEITTPRQSTGSSYIAVVGVGGAGGNAVNHMHELGIKDVTFLICNTDQQALDNSPVEIKICLGEGRGAGNVPEVGREAAVNSLAAIRQKLEEIGARMIFITAGMGGGTGTGASPVIAKLAREMGILTVAVVTSPLSLEGNLRREQALKGIEELRQSVDSLLIIDNENILKIYGRLSLKQAFGKADDILASATKGIAEIITVKSDLVNVDFADVSNVMRDSGRAHMAVATARGEDRAERAAEASLLSPLLDDNLISGAKNILINISVSDPDNLILDEVHAILDYIQSHASIRDKFGNILNANIIWGTSVKPQLDDAIELVVVATGFENSNRDDITSHPLSDELQMQQQMGGSENSDLEPVKSAPRRPMPKLGNPDLVLQGDKSTRYKDIDKLLAKPAYQTRNSKFVVMKPVVRRDDPDSDIPSFKE